MALKSGFPYILAYTLLSSQEHTTWRNTGEALWTIGFIIISYTSHLVVTHDLLHIHKRQQLCYENANILVNGRQAWLLRATSN